MKPFDDYDEVKYINGVKARFVIEPDRIVISKSKDLVMTSQALNLYARAGSYMDFDQNVDLTIDPEFLDLKLLQLPIIKQITDLLGRIKWVKVVGPIDDPKLVWPVL